MALTTTWEEIQVTALQKMFLITGSDIERNDSTNSYLAAMPSAYNEAVRLLSVTNRYIIKSYDIPCSGIGGNITINLREEIPDMFQIKPNGLYFTDAEGMIYEDFGNYRMIGQEFMVLDNSDIGTYTLYYYAYPLKVTSDTADNTDLQIDPDVASLVPLYMASQLYKEDDPSMAATYRNEFEMGRDELTKELNGGAGARFRSVTGWW